MDDPSRKIQTLRPTMEVFRNFMQCIESAERNDAHRAGLLKVIPPPEWIARKSGYKNLDNFQIKTPIRQVPEGHSGVYQIKNMVMKNSNFETFKQMSKKRHKAPKFNSFKEADDLYWESWEEMANRRSSDEEERTKNCPVYGADIEGTLTDEDVEEFNLNRLDSILNELNTEGHRISGVNTAYLYFGLWRSSFTLHTEDCDLYSINYLHFGKPKVWYTIPPEHGHRLEELARDLFPAQFKKCPFFLRHKTSVISPKILELHGIPFNTVVQKPGEFIITFPFGYHFGYNLGLNCAEATNFALPRWIDFGKAATICGCRKSNVRIDMEPFVAKYQPEQYEEWKLSMLGLKSSPISAPDSHDSGIVEEKKERRIDGTKYDQKGKKRSAPSFNIKNFVSANKKRLDYIEEVEDYVEAPAAVKTFDELQSLNIQFVGRIDERESNFENEQQYNLRLSRFEPFCSVCVCFKTCPIFAKYDMSRFEIEPPKRFKIYTRGEGKWRNGADWFGEPEKTIFRCKGCCVAVHMACYNIPPTADTSDWFCDKCASDCMSASCFLCPRRGGALKRTTNDDSWAHINCSLVLPGIHIDEQIINVDNLIANVDLSPCTFCEKLFPSMNGDTSTSQFPEYIRGYTTNCRKCSVAYHVGCAINSGIVFHPISYESFCEKCTKEEMKRLKSNKDMIEYPELEEIVIAKIYLHYSYARVKSIQEETFHRVNFIHYTKDVLTLIENANTPPLLNDFVGVLVDGVLEYGSYKGCYESKTFTVQFDTGYKLKLKRDDFLLLHEHMTKRIHDKFIESIEPLNLEVVDDPLY